MKKETIYTGELLQEKLISGHTEKIILAGRITEWLNGKKISCVQNAIQAGLLSYLASCMDQDVNNAIDNLFTANDPNAPGGTDGIVMQTDNATNIEFIPLITAAEASVNTHANKWRGQYTNASGSSVIIEQMHIGYNCSFPVGSDHSFETLFSSKVRSSALTIADGDQYELAWELYLGLL